MAFTEQMISVPAKGAEPPASTRSNPPHWLRRRRVRGIEASTYTVPTVHDDPDATPNSVVTRVGSDRDDAGFVGSRFADAARAAARVARVAANAVAEVELTLAQYRTLVFVDGVQRPATEVARLLGVTPSTLTSVIDGLSDRGLVQRGSDPTDGRRVVLSITDEGRHRLAAADVEIADRLSGLLDRLGADRASAALDGLDLLNEAMDDYVAEHFPDQQRPDRDRPHDAAPRSEAPGPGASADER